MSIRVNGQPKFQEAIKLVLNRGFGVREACRAVYGHERKVSTLSRHVNAKRSPSGTPIRNVRSAKLAPVDRYWEMEDRRSESEIKSRRLTPSPTICRRGEDMVLYGHKFSTVSTVTDLLLKLELASVTLSIREYLPPVSTDSYLQPKPIAVAVPHSR